MIDGAASLMTMMYGMAAAGSWDDRRYTNLVDGGAHFYDTYETADGRHVSIGSIEPQFYAELIRLAGLDPAHQLEVMALLRDLAAQGRVVVVVLHDLALAARFADRAILDVLKPRIFVFGCFAD